jgi:hypothetical protein
MKTTELIQALQEIQAKHGDLPVSIMDSEYGPYDVYPLVWVDLDSVKRLYFAEGPSATNSGEDDVTPPWHFEPPHLPDEKSLGMYSDGWTSL